MIGGGREIVARKTNGIIPPSIIRINTDRIKPESLNGKGNHARVQDLIIDKINTPLTSMAVIKESKNMVAGKCNTVVRIMTRDKVGTMRKRDGVKQRRSRKIAMSRVGKDMTRIIRKITKDHEKIKTKDCRREKSSLLKRKKTILVREKDRGVHLHIVGRVVKKTRRLINSPKTPKEKINDNLLPSKEKKIINRTKMTKMTHLN